jgi:glutaminase
MQELTPTQQKLMDFLNKLAIAPYSPQLMEEGNQVLDAAVAETQQLQENIHRASNALRNAQQAAFLDGGIN